MGLSSILSFSASPAAAEHGSPKSAPSAAQGVAVPVQEGSNHFSIGWQPGGENTEYLHAKGTVTLSEDQKSYTIEGSLSVNLSSQNCKHFSGGTTIGVRRDGEEYGTPEPTRWGWKLISEERGCNDLMQHDPMKFKYTGAWDAGDLTVLLDIRSNPVIGSYRYSSNARCERSGTQFNC